jgi:hypothetical protein
MTVVTLPSPERSGTTSSANSQVRPPRRKWHTEEFALVSRLVSLVRR